MSEISETIDESQFRTEVPIIALVVPAAKTNLFMKRLRDHIFNRPKMKSVLTEAAAPQILEVDLGSEGPRRAVMLSEEVSASAQADDLLAGLPSDERAWVAAEGPGVAVRHTIVLGYGDLTTEQALRRLLPPDIKEVPTAFETAGHVAHLNLREEVLPHKKLVAQVILDKNAHLRSVVNKTASIATEYRTFPLEVLAGTKDLVVELKEVSSGGGSAAMG